MGKTILYKLFGAGKIPAQYDAILKSEGIVAMDEGIKGSATYTNFHKPGSYSGWRRTGFSSSIALTNARLLAFQYSSPLIDVPLNDARFPQLQFSLKDENGLLVSFDASLFHNDWSGKIEYLFHTPQAQTIFNSLSKQFVH